MNREERLESFELALKAFDRGLTGQLWTCSPGIVDAVHFDAEGAMTVDVQLAILPQIFDPVAGAWNDADKPPLCVDVPVKFFGNSKFVCTLPLAKGDEGLLIFGKNCIDAWWEAGGIQSQLEIRNHDLSDAFFLPGIYSKPNVPANISTTNLQMRDFAGATYIEITPDQKINGVAPGGFNFNGVTIDSDGNVASPAAITAVGEITRGQGGGDQVTLGQHEHPTAAMGPPSKPTPGT